MKNKRNLKNTNIFINDDLTPLRAQVTRELRKRDSVRSVITVNEKKLCSRIMMKSWFFTTSISFKNGMRNYLIVPIKV